MKINSQQKGKRAEREVAKLINKELNTNVRRTPSSGALDFKGDIIDIGLDSIVKDYHFEIKNQQNLRIKDWWKQAAGDCSSNKTPVLIFKFEHKYFVMIRFEDFLGLLKTIEGKEE